MAVVIGKTFDLSAIQEHVARQERIVLINSKNETDGVASLIQQKNLAGPSFITCSNYSIGQYDNAFEVRESTSAAFLLQAEAGQNLMTFRPNVICQSNMTIVNTLTAPIANVTQMGVGLLSVSNMTVRGSPAALPSVEHFRVDLGPATPILSIARDRGYFQSDGGNFKLGIGTQPTEQLHVRDNAIIGKTLYNGQSIVTPKLQSSLNAGNSLEFFDGCNVISGSTTVTGDFLVEGIFKLTQKQNFLDVRIESNLEVAHVHIINNDAVLWPSLRIDHVIPTNVVNNIVTARNTQAILDIDVNIPDLNVSYRALTMDAYGRVGMGTTKPEYYLSLEATEYNKSYIGKGLILAKSSIDSAESGTCADVFVVDPYAKIGLGTVTPVHNLHIDVCHKEDHTKAIIGVYKKDNHICPFFEFSCNAIPVSVMDRRGALFIGAGISNAILPTELYNNVQCAVKGDVYSTGTLFVDGMGAVAGNKIDLNTVTLSNVGKLDVGHVNTSTVKAVSVDASSIITNSFEIPGLDISGADKNSMLSTNLDKFAFLGKVGIFSTDITTLPTTLTTTTLYANETQGKVQITAPLSQFTTSLIPTISQTYLLKLEGPSPGLVLRNTRSEAYDGNTSSARLQFNYDKTSTTTLRGSIRFENGRFYIDHDDKNMMASNRENFNLYNGTFGVYDNTASFGTASTGYKVTHFNIGKSITDATDIRNAFSITRGVQINGDLWMSASGTATPNKATINGDLGASGKITSSGGGIGYAGAGVGGVITQITSRTTSVTLHKLTGQITLFATTLAANTVNSFTLTNSFIADNDHILITQVGGTAAQYVCQAIAGAGIATIHIRNPTAAATISEAPVFKFTVLKSAIA